MSAGRILVVDDDAAMCALLDAGLGKRGFDGHDPRLAATRRSRCSTARTSTRSSSISTCRATPASDVSPGSPRTAPIRPVGGDHRVRQPRDRGRGDPRGRLRLRHQAVRDRRARADARARRQHRAPRGGGARACAAPSPSDGRFDGAGRPQRRDAQGVRPHRRVADPTHGADHRRERHRQGAGRARAPRAQPRAPAGPSSPSTARPCPRRCSRASCSATCKGAFTDARAGAHRPLRAGRRRHAVPRRDRRDAPRPAGQAAARAAGARCARWAATTRCPSTCALVAATNRDLESRGRGGRFREDLYYRLNVIHVELPPLRARGDDMLLLAQHFLEHFAAPRRQARRRPRRRPRPSSCSRYSWPGNVRELQNCIERAVALTRFDQITVEDLPETIRDYRAPRGAGRRRPVRARCRWRRSSGATSCACWRRWAAIAHSPPRSSAWIARRSTESWSATASATKSDARRGELTGQ